MFSLHAHLIRANLYVFKYQPAKALEEFATSDRIRAVVDPDNQTLLFRAKDGLSWSYLRLQRNVEAERVLRDLLDPRFTPQAVGPRYWANIRRDYGGALRGLGRYAEAISVTRAALEELQSALGADDFYVGLTWNQLGEIYNEQGRYDLAAEPSRRAYEIFRQRLGEHAETTLLGLGNLGILEYHLGHLESSVRMLSALRGDLARTVDVADPILQCTTFYLASAEAEGRIGTAAEAAALTAHLDPVAIEAAEPGKDWNLRLQALNGEIQLWQGHAAEALALLTPAIAKMRQDGVSSAILSRYEQAQPPPDGTSR